MTVMISLFEGCPRCCSHSNGGCSFRVMEIGERGTHRLKVYLRLTRLHSVRDLALAFSDI